ncbi:hypothetical protein D5F01_LYC24054 [Larimichthys crocea]|uniref:DNA (Cytosine-5)-methyltransferase 3A n=1 Tax=Larimichthys crocea TaxID=215358 RepID=A0A6G0HFS5_LARCR|nr:hypothetical protein D5F01_LYC24054 [Larimichthys crocea]
MKRPTQKTLLSLFDGTGSICGPFLRAGWNVRRLDIDGLRGADIVVDIRNWDPAVHWSGPAPDVIFAGPPCENYSSARTRAKSPRDLKLADSLVRKTIDVIEYFHTMNPTMQFFVENPDSSMLWRRWVSHRLYKDVANHPLSVFVETMNISRERNRGEDLAGGRHIEVAQRGPREFSDTDTACPGRRMHTLSELHAYPADLVEAIFKHVDGAVHCERRGVGPAS